MPEIEFTLDSTTGELTLHVKGVTGPTCDDVAKLAKQLLGEPSQERKTAEYYQRTQVRSQVRPKIGR